MPEKAIISHRGEKYEIGRGKRFYGIWAVGAPYDAPVDRWPETRDGWGQAWMRFAAIETPGTIATVPQQRAGLRSVLRFGRGGGKTDPADPAATDAPTDGVADAPTDGAAGGVAERRRGGTALLVGEGLLVLGIVLGLAGLFPDYFGGQSLLSQSDEVVPHLLYVIAWAASAGLIALSVSRPRTARLGALFALGLSVVTFGLFLSDLGEVTSGAKLGSGLVVSLLGWLLCTVGAAFALAASCRDRDPVQTVPAGRAERTSRSGRARGRESRTRLAGPADPRPRRAARVAGAGRHRDGGGLRPVLGQLHPDPGRDRHHADLHLG